MAASTPPIVTSGAGGSTDIEMKETSSTYSRQQSPDDENLFWSDHYPSVLRSETMSIHREQHDDLSKLVTKPEESSEAVQRREDGAEYPRGVKLSLIVLALCLAVFLVALEYFARPPSAIRLTD